MRTPPRLDDIGAAIIFRLQQFKIGRVLLGGTYVRIMNTWTSVTVLRLCDDGTRIFRTEDGSSFHETFVGIYAIQEFV